MIADYTGLLCRRDEKIILFFKAHLFVSFIGDFYLYVSDLACVLGGSFGRILKSKYMNAVQVLITVFDGTP